MKKEHIHSYCCLVFSMGKYRVKIGQWQKLHSASNEALRFAHIQQIFKLCFPQKTQSPKFTDFSNNGEKMYLKNYSKLTAVRCFLLLKITVAGHLQCSQEIYSSATLCLQFKYFSKCVNWVFLAATQTDYFLSYLPWTCRKVTSTSLEQNCLTLGSNHVPI